MYAIISWSSRQPQAVQGGTKAFSSTKLMKIPDLSFATSCKPLDKQLSHWDLTNRPEGFAWLVLVLPHPNLLFSSSLIYSFPLSILEYNPCILYSITPQQDMLFTNTFTQYIHVYLNQTFRFVRIHKHQVSDLGLSQMFHSLYLSCYFSYYLYFSRIHSESQ